MKTRIVCAAFVLAFCAASGAGINAEEMQMSLGFETGMGIYKADTDIMIARSPVFALVNEDTSTLFSMSGISCVARGYNPPKAGANSRSGFIVRSRMLFGTKAQTEGTVTVTSTESGFNYTERVSETVRLLDDDVFVFISDMGIGMSTTFGSGILRLCLDSGFNVSWINSRDLTEGDTFEYFGFGLLSQTAVQCHLGENMFLELGLAMTANVFSSQKGEIFLSPRDSITYKDSGRFDMVSAAAYLHLGWKFDSEKYAAKK